MPFRKLPDVPIESRWVTQQCTHPEHNPPRYIVLQPGRYEYECPGCGHKIEFTIIPNHSLESNEKI